MIDDEIDVNALTVLNLEIVEVDEDDTVTLLLVLVIELVE